MKVILKRWIGLIFFFIGCGNPFSIRDAEPPKNPSSNWIPPYSAEDVLLNFISAVKERNINNYMKCLVDTTNSDAVFQFTPDPIVAAEYPSVFTAWDDEKENTIMNLAFSQVSSDSVSNLEFTEDVEEIITPDSVVFIKKYHLVLHHTESFYPTIYKGQAEFWLIEDQRGWWAIYHWIDNSISEYRPWSYLKAILSG